MKKTSIYHITVTSDAAADIVAPYYGGTPSYSFGIGDAIVVLARVGDSPAPEVESKVAQHIKEIRKVLEVEEDEQSPDDATGE